jgi:heptosyltransferase III
MNATHLPKLKPRKILVIALRYLGDVLLTTPLLHSLRLAYPEAQLDMLVYANTANMLQGNPDIDNIITQTAKPSGHEFWLLVTKLFRQYDLAISTQIGDRPILYTLLAAPFRLSSVPPKGVKGWWKRYFVQRWVEFDDQDTHTVLQHLKLVDLLNVARHYALMPPTTDDLPHLPLAEGKIGFAVLHVCPQWVYKRWTVAGWINVGHYLAERGLQLLLSGGAVADEVTYIAEIARQLPKDTVNLAGQVSLAQLALIIARAKLFIGTDTGITHLAAATGVPVIALFGPTNPVKWAPWPIGHQCNSNPFTSVGSQQVNNIYLLQGEAACVPCHLEGCDRHRQSHSQCLDTLPAQKVKAVINQIVNLE